jgi:hypothetical protein
MSSGTRRFAVRPGGGLVVAGAGFQASVQDAGEAVSQSPECVIVVGVLWRAARGGSLEGGAGGLGSRPGRHRGVAAAG